MKKYVFSIISIFIAIFLNLIIFIDTLNIYPIHFVKLMDNMVVLFILSLISISCAIISLKKYNEQGLSDIIALLLNMFPDYIILLNFLSISSPM